MSVRKRQRGVLLLVFTAVAASFAIALLATNVLQSAKEEVEYQQRRTSIDTLSLIPKISDILLRNLALWDEDDAAGFITAISAVGFDWPLGLNIHIGAAINAAPATNNIGSRNYVICRHCANINPFNSDGSFNIANIPNNVQNYYLINGYQLQVEGISRAQKKLEDLAEVFSDAYTTFRRQELEGVLRCVAAKKSGECNYFRGCDFIDSNGVNYGNNVSGGNGLLPCTEGEADNRLAASEFGILGGDTFSIWGDIFVYNSGGEASLDVGDRDDRGQPMALSTQGPFDLQVQLLVPQPI